MCIYGEGGTASAIDRAIDAMPGDYVIKSFLEEHKAEVKGMLLAEYNEAMAMEMFKEEGREEGREEERFASIRNVMDSLKVTSERAMEILGIPSNDWPRYLAML